MGWRERVVDAALLDESIVSSASDTELDYGRGHARRPWTCDIHRQMRSEVKVAWRILSCAGRDFWQWFPPPLSSLGSTAALRLPDRLTSTSLHVRFTSPQPSIHLIALLSMSPPPNSINLTIIRFDL